MTDMRIEPGPSAAGFGVVQGGSAGLVGSAGVGADPLTAVAAVDSAAWAAVADPEMLCVATDESRSGDAGTAMVNSFVATEAANAETLTVTTI